MLNKHFFFIYFTLLYFTLFLPFNQGYFYATQSALYILLKNGNSYCVFACVLHCFNSWLHLRQQHYCWFWSDCVVFEVRVCARPRVFAMNATAINYQTSQHHFQGIGIILLFVWIIPSTCLRFCIALIIYSLFVSSFLCMLSCQDCIRYLRKKYSSMKLMPLNLKRRCAIIYWLSLLWRVRKFLKTKFKSSLSPKWFTARISRTFAFWWYVSVLDTASTFNFGAMLFSVLIC